MTAMIGACYNHLPSVDYREAVFTRRFLCAWCNVPGKKNAALRVEWQFKTDSRELHGAFPELVDADECRCVLPVTNVEVYLGSSAVNRMYLKELNDMIKRKKNISSVNAVTINHPTFIISSHTGDLK